MRIFISSVESILFSIKDVFLFELKLNTFENLLLLLSGLFVTLLRIELLALKDGCLVNVADDVDANTGAEAVDDEDDD